MLSQRLVNPYKDYILQRWHQGFYHVKQLFREIQQLGYLGGYMTLSERQLRKTGCLGLIDR